MYERRQQFKSSNRRRLRRNVIDHNSKKKIIYCSITTSLKIVYIHQFSIPKKFQINKHVFLQSVTTLRNHHQYIQMSIGTW